MLRLEWKALRVGDQVLVHDDAALATPLEHGEVVLVQPMSRSNDVSMRVDLPSGRQQVLRPRRMAVHLAPRDASEPCWRCDVVAAAAAH